MHDRDVGLVKEADIGEFFGEDLLSFEIEWSTQIDIHRASAGFDKSVEFKIEVPSSIRTERRNLL